MKSSATREVEADVRAMRQRKLGLAKSVGKNHGGGLSRTDGFLKQSEKSRPSRVPAVEAETARAWHVELKQLSLELKESKEATREALMALENNGRRYRAELRMKDEKILMMEKELAKQRSLNASHQGRLCHALGAQSMSNIWTKKINAEQVNLLKELAHNWKDAKQAEGMAARAERMMRRVGARMMNAEQVYVLQALTQTWKDAKQAERAERMMRRVGARMMNAEQVYVLQALTQNWKDAKQAERAERMMRRVGARMIMKDLIAAFDALRRKFEDSKRGQGIMHRVGARMFRVEQVWVIHALRAHFLNAKQGCTAVHRMRRVAARLQKRNEARVLYIFRRNFETHKFSHCCCSILKMQCNAKVFALGLSRF